jgi:hypothetical protein
MSVTINGFAVLSRIVRFPDCFLNPYLLVSLGLVDATLTVLFVHDG